MRNARGVQEAHTHTHIYIYYLIDGFWEGFMRTGRGRRAS